MKILFVSMVAFENNTSATIQNKGIIKGLNELGHSIDTLTLRPHQDKIDYDADMNDIKGIIEDIYYLELDDRYIRFMTKRIDNGQNKCNDAGEFHLKWLGFRLIKLLRLLVKRLHKRIAIFDTQKINVKGVAKLKINLNAYDVIISASDPKSSHLIVKKLRKIHNARRAIWIQYWGDPMYHDISRRNDFRNCLVKHSEKSLISLADRVVYASPLTLELQKNTFPKYSGKMYFANQVNIGRRGKPIYIGEKQNIALGYYGSYFSNIRNIRPLYNCAKMNNIKLNIVGESDLFLPSTGTISVQGSLPYSEIMRCEAESAILVCICNSKGTQIPGKIYYNSSYDKPIIVIIDGENHIELNRFLGSFNRFIMCVNDEESIMKAIVEASKQRFTYAINGLDIRLTPMHMAKTILREIENA